MCTDCCSSQIECVCVRKVAYLEMVGRQYDFLANPVGAIRSTFKKAIASGSDPASFDRKDWGVSDLFREFLYDNDGLNQVPILTHSTVKWVQPNSLVRFRGMIQDMLGNELYVGAYKNENTWNTNKFTDVSQFPMGPSLDMQRLWERRLLFCVPVPGQNSWADSTSDGLIRTYDTSANQDKRHRDPSSVSNEVEMQDSNNEMPDSPRAKKMRECESFQPENMKGADCGMSMVPDFDRNNFQCLVKIYDSPETDLKLNDVFEFIGVLTFDTDVRDDKKDENELESCFQDELDNLPSSKVPRLHCLVHRKLSLNDMVISSQTLEPKPHMIKELRESLLHHLTVVLGDDELAARFMLLHLLSKVHTRVDSVAAVGKLSLNLTTFDKTNISVFGNRINDAVKTLLPFSQCIPFTVEYLNTAALAPVKDYETNRLVPGVLQCAEGSHFTIDETQLQSGTLNSNGVENTRLLKDLMEFQNVEYDYKYYKMKMDADVKFLILSEGKSNILPADIVLRFHPSFVGPVGTVDEETLNSWRWYLATLRSLPHSIGTEMQKVVEDDMVAARQADRGLGTEDFNRWLTMGRLIAVSFGETCLSHEHWQMVKELERLRKDRLT